MPQILVMADAPAADGERPIMFQERVTPEDFESKHFATQLAERLGWAVGDAAEHDHNAGRHTERRDPRVRVIDAAQREMRRTRARGRSPIAHRRSARVVTTAS
jgi:hypothetical protein